MRKAQPYSPQSSMFEFLTTSQHRPFGFRLSLADVLVLTVFAAAATWLWRLDSPAWWLAPMVVGHFFLFCNVIRLRRNLELLWAVVFLGNVGWWMAQGSLDWPMPLVWQMPFTFALILIEMKSSRYHGIAARKLNPQLDKYLADRCSNLPGHDKG